jgi:hypothetical protein
MNKRELPPTFIFTYQNENQQLSSGFQLEQDTPPRFLFLALRLVAFGYSHWLNSPGCPVPKKLKNVIRHYSDIGEPCTWSVSDRHGLNYNLAGLALFELYPHYQTWLAELSPAHPLAQNSGFTKYRLLSAPVKRIPRLSREGQHRLQLYGMRSLHQLLFTFTYPQMRAQGVLNYADAARLIPLLFRFGEIPAADEQELILTYGELCNVARTN